MARFDVLNFRRKMSIVSAQCEIVELRYPTDNVGYSYQSCHAALRRLRHGIVHLP